MVEIKRRQQQDEYQCRQLRLVTYRHQNHQQRSDEVECYLEKAQLKAYQRYEHKRQKNPSRQLKIILGFVVAQRRDSSKQALGLTSAFCQHEKQRSDQCQVAEKEVEIPQNAVGECLKQNYYRENG